MFSIYNIFEKSPCSLKSVDTSALQMPEKRTEFRFPTFCKLHYQRKVTSAHSHAIFLRFEIVSVSPTAAEHEFFAFLRLGIVPPPNDVRLADTRRLGQSANYVRPPIFI